MGTSRRLTVLLVSMVLLVCAYLFAWRGTPPLKPGPEGNLPATFPSELRSFSGPMKAFGLDGKSWDSVGIGAPSNLLYVNGNYWMCVSGYTADGPISHTVGCWFGPSPTSLKPYPGNPVLVNNRPKWAADCIEAPDLNTDGVNVYMSYVGFGVGCDDMVHGAIGISSTTVGRFPAGLSAVPDEPQIPKPMELGWLFRSFITEIDGVCYDYSNAGVYYSNGKYKGRFGKPTHPEAVIASFKTNGPCATTEMSANAWKFNRFELVISQTAWEGKREIEDPQVFKTADGNYVMLYGGCWTFKAGYAFTNDPVHGVWTKSNSNPIKQNGILWLPRMVQDASGQYWMFGNFNGTKEMNIWKAGG